jgi:hypothetical protein
MVLEKIADTEEISKDYIDKYINRYYSSIGTDPVGFTDPLKPTLEDYCDHFRNQMANTTLVVDICTVSVNIEKEKRADILESFECFGIAWRLLDDINDFEEDLGSGTKNACFYALDSRGQSIYENICKCERGQSPKNRNDLFQHMDAEKTLIKIIDLIISFLKRGADAAFRSGINGFGNELLVMAAPLEEEFHRL